MQENKLIMLKEVSETGFYCAVDDNERYYIFEILNNTDEEWLKENPEQTLLIDEWIYDYTDYDDRKVYGTSGNLVATCNDISTCKVYKIEDTKYKIFGKCGQFLIEDKPTYKEQLARKTQECEQLKEINAEIQESEIELENMKNSLFIDYMKYKQAIEEIEEIAKHCQQQDICTLCKNVDKCRDDYDEFSWNVANLIIQKCDEVNNSQNIRH